MSRLYLIFLICISVQFTFAQSELGKYLKFAQEQYQKGDYIYALEYYEKAVKIDSNKVDILWNYAECLRAYKDYRNAEKYYQIVYSREEANIYPNSLVYLGLMQKHNGKYDEALETFKKAKKKFTKDKKSYQYLKSKRELESCLWAKNALKDTSKVNVLQLPETVNSKNSEFGHLIYNNTLIFSSLRPDSITDNEEIYDVNYKTKLYQSQKNNIDFEKNNLIEDLNLSGLNIGNGSFSIDGKRFYFSSCKQDGYNYKCNIYVAKFENNKWSNIDSLGSIINEQNANSTMPCIANMNNKEVLIFASDRTGSVGGLDLWMSEIKNGNQYSTPKPIKKLNTIENDITPWWDSTSNSLFFSSSWFDGFGGNDIYTSKFNEQFEEPKNLGLPINSSANDIYFFKEKDTSYVTSNRIGVLYSKNPTCCSDIFQFKPIKEIKKDEKDFVITKKETLAELNKRLPVTLYFHNDIPDPKSKDSTTKVNYINSYNEYRAMIEKYQTEYSNGLQGDKKEEAKEDIESFFIEYVDQGVKDLSLFRDLLLEELQKGAKIQVTVKGFASPLAKTDYNVNLTKRRINSLVNYLSEYENGIFLPYLNKSAENGGFVKFSQVPFGEYTANKLTSDNLNDQRNSVYSRAAMIERKIEIQSINFIEEQIKHNSLVPKQPIFDIGKIKAGTKLEQLYTITNDSDEEIEIDSIRIPCHCNLVEIEKKKIAPHESIQVKIKFDSTGYEGQVVKSIYISNKNQEGELRLILTAEIEKPE